MGPMERRVDFTAGQDSGVALKVRAVARSEVCESSWNRPASGSNAVDGRHSVTDARCAPGSAGTDLLPSGADASTRGDSSSSISSANFAQFVAKGCGSLLAMDARAMVHTASLEELLNTGVPISPHEAVAIVQQLLLADDSPAEEIDVTPADVILHANGLVDCRCGLASVEALGHLLDGILPSGGGVRVSGALRLTVARACHSIDAPAFASRFALSAALERFEHGRREVVVRELLARAGKKPDACPSTVAAAPHFTAVPRADRRSAAKVSELRRELREADERIYELLQRSSMMPPARAGVFTTAPSPARLAAVAVVAVLGSFAAGYGATELVMGSPAKHSAGPSAPVERTTTDQRATSDQPTGQDSRRGGRVTERGR
jgi:hypothetical protein